MKIRGQTVYCDDYPSIPEGVIYNPGHDELWLWFSLSYASFLTIPRVLMHSMPDKWQWKMAKLLNEYDEIFSNLPDITTRVQIAKDGKLIKHPSWILNYRHPQYDEINKFKGRQIENGESK